MVDILKWTICLKSVLIWALLFTADILMCVCLSFEECKDCEWFQTSKIENPKVLVNYSKVNFMNL
jgi:hypothetical protein